MKLRLFKSAAFSLLLLAGITGCGQKQDTTAPAQGNGAAPGAPTVNPSQSPIADPASPLYGWGKFSSADGKFSAMFPARPKEDVKSQPGKAEVLHTFASESDPDNAYMLGYYDRRQTEDPKVVLAEIEEGMVKKFNGKIVSYKTIEVDNYPATEYEFTLGNQPGRSGKVRLILTGQRVYELVVIFLTAQPHPDVCDAFFNSFSLLQN
jgi:hypothetical protein